MQWQKVNILSDSKELEAIAPVIISASRATDIPAFFAKKFIDDFANGFTLWKNHFNGQSQTVSFQNARLIVFWTKFAKPLMQYLDILAQKEINFYFQYTLNNYESENFEPNVPSLSNRIENFIELSQKIGKEKVIWRFDPLILSDNLTIEKLLLKIENIAEKLINHTNKLVFSFADVAQYTKVQKRFVGHYSTLRQFTDSEKIYFAQNLSKIALKWSEKNPKFEIATCAEDIDLEKFNIKHNKCIDDELIKKIFTNDKILIDFVQKNGKKDKNQRKFCRCIASKDIGHYNTCKFGCIYCYANK